jgi:hypothetical protein
MVPNRRAPNGLPGRPDPACDPPAIDLRPVAIALRSPYLPPCDPPAIRFNRPVFNPPIPPRAGSSPLWDLEGPHGVPPLKAREGRKEGRVAQVTRFSSLPKNTRSPIFAGVSRVIVSPAASGDLGFSLPAVLGEPSEKRPPPPSIYCNGGYSVRLSPLISLAFMPFCGSHPCLRPCFPRAGLSINQGERCCSNARENPSIRLFHQDVLASIATTKHVPSAPSPPLRDDG